METGLGTGVNVKRLHAGKCHLQLFGIRFEAECEKSVILHAQRANVIETKIRILVDSALGLAL